MFRFCKFNGLILRTNNASNRSLVSQLSFRNNCRALGSSSVLCNKVEAESRQQIYSGPLSSQIRVVKVFSLSSSMFGIVAQPIIINEADKIGSTSLLVVMCSVVGFFTFVTPVLLHFITKKYVTKMEYDPDTSTFTATTITFLCTPKELQFKAEDVVVPEIPGMFTTFLAKGKPLFVEARHFTDPTYYAKLMGYDKPMDFKLGDTK